VLTYPRWLAETAAALADVLLAVATHAQIAADDGDFAARHILAAAAAAAAALSSADAAGGAAAAGLQPRAPEGRGYALDAADDEEEEE
jgi:hypothetical protein